MTAPAAPLRHAMSVDVEDWFQVWALSEVIRRDSWEDFSLRVEASTERALDLFRRHQVKATFSPWAGLQSAARH